MGVRHGRIAGAAASSSAWIRRGIPLRAYVLGLVALFVLAAGVNVIYQRETTLGAARRAALASAAFAARTAAREIAADLAAARTQVSALAAHPGIGRAFTPGASCTLQFGGEGAFSAGHVDLIAKNGTVGCSSLAARKTPGYRGSRWLVAALHHPALAGPVTDARTGQPAVVVSAPLPGPGVAAVFLALRPVGPGLAATLAGSRHLEFVITTADESVVLARSVEPGSWVGRPVPGTPLAGTRGGGEHRDLNGTPRLYQQAVVAGVRWRVFAGESTARTFAVANQLTTRQIVLTLAGLGVFLLAALVLYRRITRPIEALSTGVRTAAGRLPAPPLPVAGPAEVSALAEDFNRLLTAAGRELEARSRLAAVADSSADAIVGLSLNGVVSSWNAGAERTLGYSGTEMAGTALWMLIPPGGDSALPAILERIRAGEPVEAEGRCLRKDNTIAEVSYTISPVRNAAGTVTGAAAVIRDITSRNRAEAARRALEDRLQQSQRLESLGQLASGIAHDFNNLLAVIMNYAGFAAEQTAGEPAARADLDQIRAAAARGARLTRQLLIFSRQEAVRPQPVDINAIVTDIHDLLSRSIGDHIDLVIRLAPGLPPIEADRGQIDQVLLNLAINARDAMPAGGTLTIQTSLTELDQDHTRAHPGCTPGRYIELAVSDTGTGMSPDVAARIFEPYFTTKRPDKGTGLGLSTVYGIVTQAGGTVTVESEPGTGTTFRLYLPAASAPPRPQPGPAAPRGNGQTILVVDDEPAVLAVTARMLRDSGYATLEAATADQALVTAASQPFQLLLTDSVLPGDSGQTLAARITALQPGVAVLYMSGHTPAPPATAPDSPGQEPRLHKPFSLQDLLQAVHTALGTPPATPGPSTP